MAYGCLGIRLTRVMCLMLDIMLTLYQNFIYMVSYNRENSFQSYIIQHKGHVFKWFQEFKALVENQTGKKIRCLRSDNGGEYTSNNFDDYCVREGIWREMTVAYNPSRTGLQRGRTDPL